MITSEYLDEKWGKISVFEELQTLDTKIKNEVESDFLEWIHDGNMVGKILKYEYIKDWLEQEESGNRGINYRRLYYIDEYNSEWVDGYRSILISCLSEDEIRDCTSSPDIVLEAECDFWMDSGDTPWSCSEVKDLIQECHIALAIRCFQLGKEVVKLLNWYGIETSKFDLENTSYIDETTWLVFADYIQDSGYEEIAIAIRDTAGIIHF